MRSRVVAFGTILVLAGLSLRAGAQTAADQIAAGDRDHAARNLTGAIAHYEVALRADPASYPALIKLANDLVDLGEFDENHAERDSLYRSAEQYARRAVAANGSDADGHFELARAIGRNALTMGARDRVKYAAVVRDEALAALAANPKHAGALHVMGVWNAEVMRLNGMTRLIARKFLGGKVFDDASWDNAQRYLEQAVAAEPGRITHHLDLGAVYADRGDRAKAAEQFELIAKLPVADYDDPRYKEIAAKRLSELRLRAPAATPEVAASAAPTGSRVPSRA